MATAGIQTRRWTRQEYERMAEAGIIGPDERVELLDGEVIPMTPQHSSHAVAVGKTEEALRAAFPSGHWVRVQMPLAIDPDSEPEPDLAVATGTFNDYVQEHPRTAVLVVEVADTPLERDRDRKRQLYARAGIPEYWIVNLTEHCLEVYRDPVASPAQACSYRSSRKLSPPENLSPLAAASAIVAVADLLP